MPRAEKDATPPCPSCGKPLGLYYAECRTCYAHARDFSLADYTRVFPPGSSGR